MLMPHDKENTRGMVTYAFAKHARQPALPIFQWLGQGLNHLAKTRMVKARLAVRMAKARLATHHGTQSHLA